MARLAGVPPFPLPQICNQFSWLVSIPLFLYLTMALATGCQWLQARFNSRLKLVVWFTWTFVWRGVVSSAYFSPATAHSNSPLQPDENSTDSVLFKIETWCLVLMKGFWTHFLLKRVYFSGYCVQATAHSNSPNVVTRCIRCNLWFIQDRNLMFGSYERFLNTLSLEKGLFLRILCPSNSPQQQPKCCNQMHTVQSLVYSR